MSCQVEPLSVVMKTCCVSEPAVASELPEKTTKTRVESEGSIASDSALRHQTPVDCENGLPFQEASHVAPPSSVRCIEPSLKPIQTGRASAGVVAIHVMSKKEVSRPKFLPPSLLWNT